jgi:hypothetical protein
MTNFPGGISSTMPNFSGDIARSMTYCSSRLFNSAQDNNDPIENIMNKANSFLNAMIISS